MLKSAALSARKASDVDNKISVARHDIILGTPQEQGFERRSIDA